MPREAMDYDVVIVGGGPSVVDIVYLPFEVSSIAF